MDIQELRQFIEASEFTPETKQKISVILAGKAILDYDTYNAVKEILQQELDEDFKSEGVDASNDPEMQKIDSDYESELEQINSTLQKDVVFAEQEMEL